MLSKKHTLLICLAGIIIFLVSAFATNLGLCPAYSYSSCTSFLNGIAEAFLPIFPLFLFSLITYWMREEIYVAWFRFARWAIPLSMLLILIAPEYSHDRMYPIEKGSIALLCSVLFAIISSIIIVTKLLASRVNKRV